jgi:4-amino-4-deoxy-L-arabinose transferase-like glycosyltransferase
MSAIDDVGYPMWLGVIYLLTGDISNVFIPFVVKSIVGAYCATLIYRVAKRHFGIGAARIAAIFVCLNPNMIYWCGTMMKEAEMVFVCCMAVDKLDHALSSGHKLTFRALLPGLLFGLYLFFLRTTLGLAFFLAIIAHLIFVSKRVISVGKKIVAGVLVVLVLFIGVCDRIFIQSQEYIGDLQSGYQEGNMEWRAARTGGNSLAKYAGATVFAPSIFTIPFPTYNAAEASQLLQIQLAGGSYVKNILSYFVIIVMITLLISGKWRDHVFILAYTCAYLGVLVFSSFAQSGRFHMPVLPMLMIFAAYGIQLAKNNVPLQRGYSHILWIEVIVCLIWNWFKLAGRGMI